MNKFLKDNWVWIAITIASLIVLTIVYFQGKKSGAGAHQTIIPDEALPANLSQSEKQRLIALAENLNEDINCYICSRTKSLYEDLSELSDQKLVAVSNIFNIKYEVDSGETFLQQLEGEFYALDGFTFKGLVEGIKDRLRNLGVS